MVITEEILNDLLQKRAIVQIEGKKYHATTDTNFAVGDMVLDRKDGLYAVIHTIIGDKAALRDAFLVQMAVPLSQLIKLRLRTEE